MSELSAAQIDAALASNEPHYLVELTGTQGSTPRDAGALMIVGPNSIFGTIGGGSAEWVAIQTVRGFIEGGEFADHATITLGPEIDQCCGGKLEVSYSLLNETVRSRISGLANTMSTTQALIFGAGHTGMALANALQPLGLDIRVIDTRPQYAEFNTTHKIINLALPEEAVRSARPGSVFVITTHDHSLDFLITSEALSRNDARYVGMIGSKTKRAVFKSWMGNHGYDERQEEKLHCPIGGSKVGNKQPEIIAAMCVAEILAALELEGA